MTPGEISLAADLDYLRKKLADQATSAWDQSNEHWTQKRWELRGINKALRYCQTHLDWLLDVRHRPGGPNPLAPQTPPSEVV